MADRGDDVSTAAASVVAICRAIRAKPVVPGGVLPVINGQILASTSRLNTVVNASDLIDRYFMSRSSTSRNRSRDISLYDPRTSKLRLKLEPLDQLSMRIL